MLLSSYNINSFSPNNIIKRNKVNSSFNSINTEEILKINNQEDDDKKDSLVKAKNKFEEYVGNLNRNMNKIKESNNFGSVKSEIEKSLKELTDLEHELKNKNINTKRNKEYIQKIDNFVKENEKKVNHIIEKT